LPAHPGAVAGIALALLLAPGVWAADAAPSPAPTASAADRPPIEAVFAGTLTYGKRAPGDEPPPLSRQVESWGYAGPRPLARTDVIQPKPGDQFGLLLVANASVLKSSVGRLVFITRVPAPGIERRALGVGGGAMGERVRHSRAVSQQLVELGKQVVRARPDTESVERRRIQRIAVVPKTSERSLDDAASALGLLLGKRESRLGASERRDELSRQPLGGQLVCPCQVIMSGAVIAA